MTLSLPYRYQKKDITFVLPHPFLIDNFRHYEEEDTITHVENLAKMMLISEVIMRKRAFNPTAFYFGATSELAIETFEKKMGDISSFSKLNLEAFKETLFIDDSEDIRKLGPQGSIIAVADKLLKTYSVNPIIVARGDSVRRWKETYIKDYYKKHTSKKEPIAVFSVDDALQYIRQKDKTLYYSARDSIKDTTLRCYLPK